MNHFMFGIVPNADGEFECIAKDGEKEISFKITEGDLKSMQRYLYIWKANQLAESEESP